MIVIRGVKRGAEAGEHLGEASTELQENHARLILQQQQQQQQHRLSGTTPTHHSTASAKCVEQLDPVTKAVLRVYPSGTKAAAMMGINTTGISLCINGQREDYYGFAWRLYNGPRLDCKNIIFSLKHSSDLIII